jgi:MEMO1 family protein
VAQQGVRPPAVAGTFFPASPEILRSQVADLLAAVPAPGATSRPKALIVPHAGYRYSGQTAAVAYRLLAPYRAQFSRVVLLGPAHRVRLSGLALPSVMSFATPLGTVPLDRPGVDAVCRLPQVCVSDEAHALEHSLEVHLPFLQQSLEAFSLVPLVVGKASPEQVAEALQLLWGGDETLVVVSSDLSHYLPYADAQTVDRRTTTDIAALHGDVNHEQACGATAVNGLTLHARRCGLEARLLDYRNSGDTAGDRSRVVGYASFAFYPRGSTPGHDRPDGVELVRMARAAIAGRFGLHYTVDADAGYFDQPAATFVTLQKDGRLRGCIGSLHAHRSLREDVRENAQAAAFRDPRFAPLAFDELRSIDVEVSLLSALEPIAFTSEPELLARLRPGHDGLVMEFGNHRGTFLPQVWESIPAPDAFLRELKRKAGLAPEFWDPAMRVSRYRVDKWSERKAGR